MGKYAECAAKLQKMAGTDIKLDLIEEMLAEVDDTIGFGSTMQEKIDAINTVSKKKAFEKKMLMRVKAKDLINILRARTFAGYESAYMVVDGKKYYIRVAIEKDRDGKKESTLIPEGAE